MPKLQFEDDHERKRFGRRRFRNRRRFRSFRRNTGTRLTRFTRNNRFIRRNNAIVTRENNEFKVTKARSSLPQGYDEFGGLFARLRLEPHMYRLKDYTFNIGGIVAGSNVQRFGHCKIFSRSLTNNDKGSYSNWLLDVNITLITLEQTVSPLLTRIRSLQQLFRQLQTIIQVFAEFTDEQIRNAMEEIDNRLLGYVNSRGWEHDDQGDLILNENDRQVDTAIKIIYNELMELGLLNSTPITSQSIKYFVSEDVTIALNAISSEIATLENYQNQQESQISSIYGFPYKIFVLFVDTSGDRDYNDEILSNLSLENNEQAYRNDQDIIIINSGNITVKETIPTQEGRVNIFENIHIRIASDRTYNNNNSSEIVVLVATRLSNFIADVNGSLSYKSCN